MRRYIPKGTDIGKYTHSEIEEIEWRLNNRSRKCLGFQTPTEVFQQLISYFHLLLIYKKFSISY